MGKIALASVLKAVYSPNSLFSFEEKDILRIILFSFEEKDILRIILFSFEEKDILRIIYHLPLKQFTLSIYGK